MRLPLFSLLVVGVVSVGSVNADSPKSPSIESRCGKASIQLSPEKSGAVCFTVCGGSFALASCARSGERPTVKQRPPADVGAEVQFAVFGHGLTLGDLSRSLHDATMWQVELSPAEAKVPVKEMKWSGDLRALSRVRLKVRGGEFGITIDTAGSVLRLSRVVHDPGIW
jgi:hypothetical protein